MISLTKISLRAGFLRQWPALPQFGIFLTQFVLPVPNVKDRDRYVAHRVDSLAGFYAVAQYRGFRDDPQLRIDEIVTKIIEIESRAEPDSPQSQQIVAQLRDLSRRPTHVYGVPHFRVAVTCAEQRNAAFPIIWLKANAWNWAESRLLRTLFVEFLSRGFTGVSVWHFIPIMFWIGY